MTSPPADRFITTRWSLVLAASDDGSQQTHRALADLCEAYWQPVYAFIRRRERNPEAALDLTQEFFARFLEKKSIRDADPQRGRFRSFLLTAVCHFLNNEFDRSMAQKRGGQRLHFSLDADAVAISSLAETPEREYDRLWGLTLLERALTRLRERYSEQGKVDLFTALHPCLTTEQAASSYAKLGERLGMSEGAVKVAVHRLRTRFGKLLREEIAETVDSSEDVDSEVCDLFNAFSR